MKFLLLLLLSSCVMSPQKKIYKDYIKDLIKYETKIKNEILAIDQDYPVLYSSQTEVKDSIVEDLYKSLNIIWRILEKIALR